MNNDTSKTNNLYFGSCLMFFCMVLLTLFFGVWDMTAGKEGQVL